MKWFKFYGQDYLSDPKVLALTACERSCWISLLAYASVNDNGMITYLSEEQLMIQAGVSPMHDEWVTTQGVLEKFKKLQMITLDNELITVLNWQKRQETNLTSYERVKRYREKKRNDNAYDNDRVEEKRIDNTSKVKTLPVTIVQVTDEDKEIKTKTKPKYPNARTAFSWFPKVEPSWLLNTTELKHGELLFLRGEKQVKAALRYVAEHKDEEYFPTVTKPSDLERKWRDIVAKHNK